MVPSGREQKKTIKGRGKKFQWTRCLAADHGGKWHPGTTQNKKQKSGWRKIISKKRDTSQLRKETDPRREKKETGKAMVAQSKTLKRTEKNRKETETEMKKCENCVTAGEKNRETTLVDHN